MDNRVEYIREGLQIMRCKKRVLSVGSGIGQLGR